MPIFGAMRLQRLRPDQIDAAKAAWLSGERSTADVPLSNSTVHQHLVVLGAALRAAERQQLIVRNPMAAVSVPTAKNRQERRALDLEEIALLLRAARGDRLHAPVGFSSRLAAARVSCSV